MARALNEPHQPVYGLYIVGTIWNFMVLNTDNRYCVSQDYSASDSEIFAIFYMIKSLRDIVRETQY